MGDTSVAAVAHRQWIADVRAQYERWLEDAARGEVEGTPTGQGLVDRMANVEIDEPPVFRSHSTRGSETAHGAGSFAAVDEAWLRTHPPLVRRQAGFRE